MATALLISTRLTILFIILSEHMINFMIPTCIAYMMEDFIRSSTLPEDLDEQVSYRSGCIEGLNRLMSFIGCLFWGSVSDRLGLKYSLLIVLSGLAISSLGFGLSTSFEIAVAWRMIAGLCAGTVPITKALLRDLSDDSNIAVLYSYFGTGYGLASIVGPLVGGTFSHPYRSFSVFDTGFFHEFPYFMTQVIQ